MKQRKIMNELSVLALLIVLSVVAINPIGVSVLRRQASRQNISFSQSLDGAIKQAIAELTQEQTKLALQKADVTEIAFRISKLMHFSIPSELADQRSAYKQVMGLRLEAWKAITATAKNVWLLNNS